MKVTCQRDALSTACQLVSAAVAARTTKPVLSNLKATATDDAVRLGRSTEWTDDETRPVRGTGLRVFLAGDDAFSLLDWREFQSR